MPDSMRTALELGPKAKKFVAVAVDWPGLSRGASSEDAAIERLHSYRSRYARVADLAGLGAEFADQASTAIVERYAGTGSTDFWGISFAYSSIDKQVMSREELDRSLTLMQACWTFFDEVRWRVSAELAKGPRGGGRDRDKIVRHVVYNEHDWVKKFGMPGPAEDLLSEAGLIAHRQAYVNGIQTHHAQGKMARTWPLRYLIRHTAFHTLDHAWEMEDKDLTEKS
jgi:hypothetical protein